MKVYLVRHGESVYNAEKRHQFSHTPLSEKGMRQAQFVAKRFTHIAIDHIYASTHTRALQTAETIAAHIGKQIETLPQLVELKRPSELEGKLHSDPEVIRVKQIIKENYHREEFRFSDEETFSDLKKRVQEVVTLLEKKPYENVLVVTHGDTLRSLLGLLLFGNDLTAEQFRQLKLFKTDNTGISVVEYSDKGWAVETWNDNAHLGEV